MEFGSDWYGEMVLPKATAKKIGLTDDDFYQHSVWLTPTKSQVVVDPI